jgi:hypothetical protein
LNLKNIHIGQIVQSKVKEKAIKQDRITKYFDCYEEQVNKMYQAETMDTGLLLGWSKLLKVDFF